MPEYSVWFVSLLGIGTVFLGLVCIVILCSLVSFLCRKALGDSKNDALAAPAPAVAPKAAPAPAAPIANRSKIVAAVSAVIAEELGTDVSAIRVKSFKKI
ncbi:MAG: OadG family protein [Oscillospiraceae bacterium]|nr:OadG family protein [Oscillospiraceae bacterium]